MIHIIIHEDGSYTWRHLLILNFLLQFIFEFYWINNFPIFTHCRYQNLSWFNAGVIKALKTKYRLFNSTNRTKSLTKSYCEFIENDLNRNPGRFWQFMFCQNGSKKVPNTIVLNSKVTQNLRYFTDVFALFFKYSYTLIGSHIPNFSTSFHS